MKKRVVCITGGLACAYLCLLIGMLTLPGNVWPAVGLTVGIVASYVAAMKYGSLFRDVARILIGKLNRMRGKSVSADPIYPMMSDEQRSSIDKAVRITFTGDLILLREMVERAYDSKTKEHHFDKMFEHVTDIWKKADLSIGVFEGPMGGEAPGWSTSNYDDGVPLALNFPDSFGAAVKRAGINLVTVANNHLHDVGLKAWRRTLDELKRIGLDYVGAYQDSKEYDEPKTLKISNGRGKVVILAYTFTLNGQPEEFFFNESTRYLMRPMLGVGSKYFKKNEELVRKDFERAKAENPDLIIVLPHMGEQFLHAPDKTQRRWCDLFIELGADIIFSDHPHAVQPIEWRKGHDGRQALVVHCPGNFINSYTNHDGDASMIVSAYLDPNTFAPVAASVVPVYAYCPQEGMWTGMPVSKALGIHGLSRMEYRRLSRVHHLVTGVALGAPLGLDNVQDEYFTFPGVGYVRQKVKPVSLGEEDKGSLILEEMRKAHSVCFVGDSITEGTKNGGYGWYEPLAEAFPEKRVARFAKGARTSRYFLAHARDIALNKADLYVIAVGCNDIRYRDSRLCAMTAADYTENLGRLADSILEQNPSARILFIAPWRSLAFDANFKVADFRERDNLYKAYTAALEKMCEDRNFSFLDPNPEIFDRIGQPTVTLKAGRPADYLTDFIHPNADKGIRLYSEAVIKCG